MSLCPLYLGVTLLLAVPDAMAQPAASPALEVVTVVGRRDRLGEKDIGPASAFLDFQDQVSLNRTVGDWIEQVPGVSLNGQGGLFQAYSIRGFSRARIRTELNGVPIFTDRRAGNAVSFLPPALIEDVHVSREASSALYGSGAMGGVVALTSPRHTGTRLTLEGQSNDGQMGFTALAGDAERLSGGISVRQADRAEAPDGTELNTGFEQMAGFVQAAMPLGDLDLNVTWVPSVGRDIGKSNRLYPEERNSDYPRDDHSVTSVELRAPGTWLLRAYHHYQDWDANVRRVGVRSNLTEYRAHTVGGLFTASTRSAGGEGSWGMEWIGRRGVSIKDSEFTPDDQLLFKEEVLDGTEDNIGAFVDQHWTRGGLRMTAGLRFDYVQQSEGERRDSDNQWSGSLAMNLPVSDRLSFNAELASGYRFPSLSERYFSGQTPRGAVLGNPDLEPETRRNAEVGLRYTGASGLSFGVETYYSDLQDYIERFEVSDDLVSYRNLEGAHIRGTEVDLALDTGPLQHRLSYQWQRGEDDEGAELADLNPPTWRYFTSWRGEDGVLVSDLSYRQRRDEFGAGELPLDEAWIWNARWTRPLPGGWEGQLFLNNILDERYVATADDVAPLQPGRIVGFRITWQSG